MITSRKYFIIGGRGYIGKKLFASIPKYLPVIRTSSHELPGFLRLRFDAVEEFRNLPICSGDVVFLTASISAPDICSREYEWAHKINVVGTSQFISSAIDRGARVIFFSSDTVYGEYKNIFDESAQCKPTGAYAEMKREVEHRFSDNESFKAIRLSYVFSIEDKFSRYLADCALKNYEAEIFHPFYRAVVHRDDVIKGALALANYWERVPERIINFGGPQVLSRIEFAECLRETSLHSLRFKVTEPAEDFFKSRPRTISMSSSIFSRLLGRSPHTLQEAARLEFGSTSNIEFL